MRLQSSDYWLLGCACNPQIIGFLECACNPQIIGFLGCACSPQIFGFLECACNPQFFGFLECACNPLVMFFFGWTYNHRMNSHAYNSRSSTTSCSGILQRQITGKIYKKRDLKANLMSLTILHVFHNAFAFRDF